MANCSYCSAPLPPSGIQCAYCGSRNDVDLAAIHYHTTHETESPRTCPRCSTHLSTIDLGLEGGKFLIERCDSCLGLFFDPGELETLLEKSVSNVFEINERQINSINNAQRSADYGVCYLKCPECSQLMNRMNFGTKSGVIVDRCKEHGVWLDGGELRHLMEWMKAGGKLLDQQRKEEREKEEAAAQRKAASLGSGAPCSGAGSGGYWHTGNDDSDLGYRMATTDYDVLKMICNAIGYLLR